MQPKIIKTAAVEERYLMIFFILLYTRFFTLMRERRATTLKTYKIIKGLTKCFVQPFDEMLLYKKSYCLLLYKAATSVADSAALYNRT